MNILNANNKELTFNFAIFIPDPLYCYTLVLELLEIITYGRLAAGRVLLMQYGIIEGNIISLAQKILVKYLLIRLIESSIPLGIAKTDELVNI